MDAIQPMQQFPSPEVWESQLMKSSHALMDWLTPAWEQLKKDFRPHAELSDPASWPDAVQLTEEALSQLLLHSVDQFHHVLYCIDLPEARSARLLQREAMQDRLTELAKLVLWRECQKIWIRKHWSS